MADSQEELQQEFEEYEQAEASLDSGLESAPRPREGAGGGVPPWIKWVILADFVIVAVVLLLVFVY